MPATELRLAEPEDAKAILEIIGLAYDATTGLFSVYQSKNSEIFLRSLISDRSEEIGQRFIVLDKAGSVQGFYNAMESRDSWFLNHIAVLPGSSGLGYGGRLLSDFESEGVARGFEELQLDVFAGNTRALDWYRRRGYRELVRSTYLLISLQQEMDRQEAGAGPTGEELSAALRLEAQQGFAELSIGVGRGEVLVTLIAGVACRIRETGSVPAQEAIRAVACHFAQSRTWLISEWRSDREPPDLGVSMKMVESLRLSRRADFRDRERV